MQGRISCLVPGCRRTTPREKWPRCAEWICGKHWGAVPKTQRRVYNRAKRRERKDPGQRVVAARIWRRCRRRAIEEALMGVSV